MLVGVMLVGVDILGEVMTTVLLLLMQSTPPSEMAGATCDVCGARLCPVSGWEQVREQVDRDGKKLYTFFPSGGPKYFRVTGKQHRCGSCHKKGL